MLIKFSFLDSDAQRALERDPYVVIALMSLAGGNCLLSQQWNASLTANSEKLTLFMEGGRNI